MNSNNSPRFYQQRWSEILAIGIAFIIIVAFSVYLFIKENDAAHDELATTAVRHVRTLDDVKAKMVADSAALTEKIDEVIQDISTQKDVQNTFAYLILAAAQSNQNLLEETVKVILSDYDFVIFVVYHVLSDGIITLKNYEANTRFGNGVNVSGFFRNIAKKSTPLIWKLSKSFVIDYIKSNEDTTRRVNAISQVNAARGILAHSSQEYQTISHDLSFEKKYGKLYYLFETPPADWKKWREDNKFNDDDHLDAKWWNRRAMEFGPEWVKVAIGICDEFLVAVGATSAPTAKAAPSSPPSTPTTKSKKGYFD